MIYKLILQNQVDGLNTKSWTVKPPATIGRDPSASVCIDHESISRNHCQFSFNLEEALVVKDLESTNGTYVDDERIHQTVLMPGQIIQIGALRLKIDFSTEDEHAQTRDARPKGSVYATQPMKTMRPPAPVAPIPMTASEKPWWRRIFGD